MTPRQALKHHVTGAIERGEKQAIIALEGCNTPLHTCDALENAIKTEAHKADVGDPRFVSVDTRVLAWLIADARRLNRIVADSIT